MKGPAIAAALGLLTWASTAHAQADAKAYGVIDFSYGQFEPSGADPEHRWNSNSLSPSFVGAAAKYTFDGGWSPGATLETFLRIEDLKTGRRDSDPLFSRNAYASLDSPYGSLRIGRQQTNFFETVIRFNALGNAVFFSPAIRHLFTGGALDGVQGDVYWDRSVSYTLPRIDGVLGGVMYAQGTDELRGDYWGASGTWTSGFLAVSLSGQDVKVNDEFDPQAGIDENAWALSASYNFGVAKVFGLYARTDDRALDVRTKTGSAGLSVPVGTFTLVGQVAVTHGDGPAIDRKHTTVSGGVLYNHDTQLDVYVLGMDDRVKGQPKGVSCAVGARFRF